MPAEPTGETLRAALSAIEEGSPLVQHLTNEVTMSETANVTLHWGGLPVMADALAEAGEMAAGADAVLINTGRMTEDDVDAMVAAGHGANDAGAPVVLDPVGYGATDFRVAAVNRILEEVDVSLIKGNYGEVSALAGETATVKGVESVGEYAEIAASASALAAETDATVVASGATDVVADAEDAYEVAVGHELMGSFVGSGCMLGSTLATVAAVAGTDGEAAESSLSGATEAALTATAAYGLAGERAAERDVPGPASYRTAFMDAVATLASERPALDVAERLTRVTD